MWALIHTIKSLAFLCLCEELWLFLGVCAQVCQARGFSDSSVLSSLGVNSLFMQGSSNKSETGRKSLQFLDFLSRYLFFAAMHILITFSTFEDKSFMLLLHIDTLCYVFCILLCWYLVCISCKPSVSIGFYIFHTCQHMTCVKMSYHCKL